jgi:hypothetical protein
VHHGKDLAPLPDKPEPLGPLRDKSGAYRIHCLLAGSLDDLGLAAAATLVRGSGGSGSRTALLAAFADLSAVDAGFTAAFAVGDFAFASSLGR